MMMAKRAKRAKREAVVRTQIAGALSKI